MNRDRAALQQAIQLLSAASVAAGARRNSYLEVVVAMARVSRARRMVRCNRAAGLAGSPKMKLQGSGPQASKPRNPTSTFAPETDSRSGL